MFLVGCLLMQEIINSFGIWRQACTEGSDVIILQSYIIIVIIIVVSNFASFTTQYFVTRKIFAAHYCGHKNVVQLVPEQHFYFPYSLTHCCA